MSSSYIMTPANYTNNHSWLSDSDSVRSLNDSERLLPSHLDTDRLVRTLKLRDCKCQRLVTQTQSQKRCRESPSEGGREGGGGEDLVTEATLVPCYEYLTHSVRPIDAPPLSAFLKHSSQCLIILVQYHCWMLIGSPSAAVYSPFKGPRRGITLPSKLREDFFYIQMGQNQTMRFTYWPIVEMRTVGSTNRSNLHWLIDWLIQFQLPALSSSHMLPLDLCNTSQWPVVG